MKDKVLNLNIKVAGNHKSLTRLVLGLYLDGYLGDDLDETIRLLKLIDKKFDVKEVEYGLKIKTFS